MNVSYNLSGIHVPTDIYDKGSFDATLLSRGFISCYLYLEHVRVVQVIESSSRSSSVLHHRIPSYCTTECPLLPVRYHYNIYVATLLCYHY